MEFGSHNLKSVLPSATIAMSQKARQMIANGQDVILLSQGEPDFDTPEHIREAAKAAIDQGHTRYTNVDGIIELKRAIIEKFKRDNQLNYDIDEINISPGGKAVLFNALIATLNPGDEVIIPTPCWVSYPEMVRLCGGTPKLVHARQSDGFLPSLADIEKAISARTKWIILNSPSNPTGAIMSEGFLAKLAEILRRNPNLLVLTDDIYEQLIYEGEFMTLAQVAPDLKDRILTMNGVSKAYAMTGWRIGYAGGPKWLIAAMKKVMSQTTSNPSSISMWASVAALGGPQDFLADWRQQFLKRRNLVVDALSQSQNIICRRPEGAFYVFGNCQALLGKKSKKGRTLASDMDFTDAVLEEAKVALVPGTAFHAPGHFRLSFALDLISLKQACDRIAQFCEQCR
ncbi:MAG: pyridoxal phosphate-dependent aminotransferase [Hellea sp.]|nr:pyridoxal phosphate-dependent aminotransferase [Hellea sp.]